MHGWEMNTSTVIEKRLPKCNGELTGMAISIACFVVLRGNASWNLASKKHYTVLYKCCSFFPNLEWARLHF